MKSLQLVEDAIELLQSIEKPIAVISICGPQLSGKSYFISHVLGNPGAFELGHNREPCTRGIWMATTVLECRDFAIVFLDSEGIALNLPNPNQAVIFLTFLTHLSSFLIYNTNIFTMISSLSQVFTSFLTQCKQLMTADTMEFFHPKFLCLF